MAFKLPKLNIKGANIKEGMQRKYGTGEYARGGKKFEQRMKPGESKFQADVRRRQEANKAKRKQKRMEEESIKLADKKYGEAGIEIKEQFRADNALT